MSTVDLRQQSGVLLVGFMKALHFIQPNNALFLIGMLYQSTSAKNIASLNLPIVLVVNESASVINH